MWLMASLQEGKKGLIKQLVESPLGYTAVGSALVFGLINLLQLGLGKEVFNIPQSALIAVLAGTVYGLIYHAEVGRR